MSSNIDNVFYRASCGDHEAFDELFFEFQKMGRSIVYSLIEKFHVQLKVDDFYPAISEIFIATINTYDPKNARFRTYSKILLERRLMKVVKEFVKTGGNKAFSLDEFYEEDVPLLETIPDNSLHPIPNQISINNFYYTISSPKNKNGKDDKFRSKVNTLLCAGYTQKDICTILNTSLGRIRYAIKKNNEDAQICMSKLELK